MLIRSVKRLHIKKLKVNIVQRAMQSTICAYICAYISLCATFVMQGGDQLWGNVLQQDQARLQGDAHEARHDYEQGRDIHQVQRQIDGMGTLEYWPCMPHA